MTLFDKVNITRYKFHPLGILSKPLLRSIDSSMYTYDIRAYDYMLGTQQSLHGLRIVM